MLSPQGRRLMRMPLGRLVQPSQYIKHGATVRLYITLDSIYPTMLLYLWVHRTCICHQEAILATAHALVTAIGGTRIRFRMFGILHIGARKQIATI